MALPSKPTGCTSLDVYRYAKSGDAQRAIKFLRCHIKKHGSPSDLFEPDKHDAVPFELWGETREARLLEVLEPHGIPWTPRGAIAWGKLDTLRELIAEDPILLEQRFRHDRDLLHYALMAGECDIATWLIAQGFDPTLAERNYVYATIRCRSADVIRFIVERGAPVDGRAERTALHHECNHGWTRLVPCLLELGADPNLPDCDGNTALHLAAQRGNATRLVQMLLEAGADPSIRNDQRETPLDIAKRARDKSVARLLGETFSA